MKITARKVAKDLGVSAATVSLAINDRPGVNEETRKRIMAYIRQIEESTGDKGLQGKSIKMLIYIQSDFHYRSTIKEFSQRDYAQICRLVQEEGMDLKLYYIYNRSELEEIIQDSEYDQTAGILLSLDEADEELVRGLPEGKVPVIMHDIELPVGTANFDVINLHNEQGIKIGLDYLRNMGHRNILYLYNEETIYNFRMRRRAFESYWKMWRKEEAKMIQISGSAVQRVDEAERLFSNMPKLPDAVFTENFAITSSVLSALSKLNLSVPDDISVLGIDDPQLYYYTDQSITCVEVPIMERNDITIRRLLERMKERKHYPYEMRMGMKLKEGNTVKKMKH